METSPEPTRAQEKPTPEPTSNAVPTRAQEEPTPEPTSNAANVHRNIAGAQNSPTAVPVLPRDANAMDIQWVSMDLQIVPVFPLKTVYHPLTEISFIQTDPTIQWVSMDMQLVPVH